jgi:hypothetical protein
MQAAGLLRQELSELKDSHKTEMNDLELMYQDSIHYQIEEQQRIQDRNEKLTGQLERACIDHNEMNEIEIELRDALEESIEEANDLRQNLQESLRRQDTRDVLVALQEEGMQDALAQSIQRENHLRQETIQMRQQRFGEMQSRERLKDELDASTAENDDLKQETTYLARPDVSSALEKS